MRHRDPDKRWSCGGKSRYPTYRIAERYARGMRRNDKGCFRPYRCRHCQGYHVGEDTKREGRRQVEETFG